MSPERIPSLSEQQRVDLEKVAQKMRAAKIDYPTALRQVINGRGVTNEVDIKKQMSALAGHIDAEIERQSLEAEALATEQAEIEADISVELKRRAREQDEAQRRAANEHIIDPDGVDQDYFSDEDSK